MALSRWTFLSRVEPTPSEGTSASLFGMQICQTADGSTVFVGASGASGGIGPGRVYVFVTADNGHTWTQELFIQSPGGDAQFGRCLSCSADGSHLVVGCASGTTFVFTDLPSSVVPITLGTPVPYNVAMSADGNTIVVASLSEIQSLVYDGSTYQVVKTSDFPVSTTQGGLVMSAANTRVIWSVDAHIVVFQGANLDIVYDLDPPSGVVYGGILCCNETASAFAYTVTGGPADGLTIVTFNWSAFTVTVNGPYYEFDGDTITGLGMTPSGDTIMVGTIASGPNEGRLGVLRTAERWATHAVVQVLFYATTPSLTPSFQPRKIFALTESRALVGNPVDNTANVLDLETVLRNACDNVTGTPSHDAALSYVAQQPSSVSGRPPSDAAFSFLRVGPSRSFGLVDQDGAWTHYSVCK